MSNVSTRLENESRSLGIFIENEHKTLISKSYRCMSWCFRSDKNIDECNQCAVKCHNPVQVAQDEIQVKVDEVKNFFEECIKNCGARHGG